jgi:hypothetical protein
MGAATRSASALRLSPDGSEPAGGRGTAEYEGSGGGLPIKDWARKGHRADLPAGATGETAEAAEPSAGCREGARQRSGADCRELGGGATQLVRTSRKPLNNRINTFKVETPGGGSPDLVL